jgi:hypothetical protein
MKAVPSTSLNGPDLGLRSSTWLYDLLTSNMPEYEFSVHSIGNSWTFSRTQIDVYVRTRDTGDDVDLAQFSKTLNELDLPVHNVRHMQ